MRGSAWKTKRMRERERERVTIRGSELQRQWHSVWQTDRQIGWTEVMNAVIKLFQPQRGLFSRHYKGNNLSPLIGPVSFLLAHFDLPAYCLDVSYSIANLGQF